MLPDTDMLEQETEVTEGQKTETAQVPVGGEPAGTMKSRQDLLDEAFTEGEEEAAITDIARLTEGRDVTIEDLRRLPGASELSDDQLLATWNAAVAEAGDTAEETTETTTEAYKLPFPIYDGQGNKVDALDNVSLKDLLDGKLTVGYNAVGKEQRKTLTEVLRNASLGHFNEQRYATTVSERDSINRQFREAQAKIDQYTTERRSWEAALAALAMGNVAPMEQLARAYQTALVGQAPNVPGMVSAADVQQQRDIESAGLQFFTETVVPKGYEIAQKYGADAKEVINGIKEFIGREGDFLTQEKFQAILDYEVPAWLERNGYSVGGETRVTTPQSGDDRVAKLEAQITALQATIAKNANTATQQVRDKGKKAPPAGGGSVASAGDSMPTFKTRAQFKAWAQGDPDWVKA